jgi:hypothetical protein
MAHGFNGLDTDCFILGKKFYPCQIPKIRVLYILIHIEHEHEQQQQP